MKVLKSKSKYLVVFLSILICSFFVGNSVDADTGGAVASIIGNILQPFIWVLGKVLVVLIDILIGVAQYGEFIKAPPVTFGWIIVRDICNMFFILILLIIAFATILKIESYSAKKLLPKLFLMAIMINFSKTICGLAIDFSQIIMLTFVNGFKEMGSANMTQMLGIEKLLNISTSSSEAASFTAVTGSIILALLYIIISIVVVGVLVATLVMRAVMLWIYIVLSPLAYLLSAFPSGQKYASQWWGDFSKQVVVGPLLAFFIWLSFISLGGVTVDNMPEANDKIKEIDKITSGNKDSVLNAAITEAGTPDHMLKFIISIGMLMGGLMVTQQLGGAAASAAGKGMAMIQKGKGMAWGGTKMGADYLNRIQAGGMGLPFSNKKLKGSGIDLNVFRQGARIKGGLERTKARELDDMEEIASSRLQKGGMVGAFGGITSMGWTDQYLRGFMGLKGVESAVRGREGSMDKYKKNEKDFSWKAKNTMTEDEYKEKMKSLSFEKAEARMDGDEKRQKEVDSEFTKLHKNKKDLVFSDKETADKKREYYSNEAVKNAQKIAKYTVFDYVGKKTMRSAANEEAGKISSSNEDELVAQFENAVALNNAPLATALAQAISKVGGGNALLNKFGYQAKGGLNKKEAQEAKDDVNRDYNDEKGFNDFMRDIFMKKLGIDDQNAMTIQSDLGGIGEGVGHEYLIKTVGVDSQGKFYQVDSSKREEIKYVEKMKREPEKVIRNNNRLDYGSENKDTGEFEWSDSGLAYAMGNIQRIHNEIDMGRFNRSAAKAFASDKALKKLMATLKSKGITKTGFKDFGIEDFEKDLKKYVSVSERDDLTDIDA